MKTTYYIFSPGRISRKDNSIFFSRVDEETKEEKTRFLPIENTRNLNCFGHLDINSELLTYLGKKGISFHFLIFMNTTQGVSFLLKTYSVGAVLFSRHYSIKMKNRGFGSLKGL